MNVNAWPPVILLVSATFAATSAHALTAASADDICSPGTDPCVISATYDVTGPLDFGERTVRLTGPARLRGQPDISITCGQLELQTGATAYPVIEGDGGNGGSVAIDVDPGSILGDGRIGASGSNPGSASIRARGDIILQRRLNFSATTPGAYAADIEILSGGSVVATGPITIATAPGTNYDYDTSGGGSIEIRAAVDVDVSGGIDALGTAWGGSVTLDAGRDITVGASIRGAAGDGAYANGGRVELSAGRDILVVQTADGEALQEISTDGGGRLERYGYGYGLNWESGYGGYQYLRAIGDILVGPSARLHSDGGPGASGGYIYLSAYGKVDVRGEVRAQGPPPEQSGDGGAGGGGIRIYSEESITLAQGALVHTASLIGGGYVALESLGPVSIDGEIDVRATQPAGEYDYPSNGQFVVIGTDIDIAGKLRAGAAWRSDDDQLIDACRLRLAGTARIDASFGSPNPDNDGVDISVGESMVAAAGSRILTDGVGDNTTITYRDPGKPPLLNGVISPAPSLAVNPTLDGCPVCGNSEIDEGESCDDGNTVSGDGCRNDCQDEGCLAESPGYPVTALCNDGAGCTLDRCDPVLHRCIHVVSCEEGVACTADTCQAGACQHEPLDSICDDHNECTDDLCNASTGCVHADLTGGACNDADYCTAPGTCDHGDCMTDSSAYATAASLAAAMPSGDTNDRLKGRIDLPLGLVTSDPSMTGVIIAVLDDGGASIYEARLQAANWSGRINGRRHRFRDAEAATSTSNGISSATLSLSETAGLARLTFKMKGSEIPALEEQERVNVSALFGEAGSGECLTALRVPCARRGGNIDCRTSVSTTAD
ncbi:MAG TPA: hypothetical protein VEC57_05705 [Candidatus Limnocylindrales bacterium]|nr:hypothetical protein [Candidatus Limnocylindrales bacterium]